MPGEAKSVLCPQAQVDRRIWSGWEGILRGPCAMLLPGGQHSGQAGAVPSQVSCAEKGEPGRCSGEWGRRIGWDLSGRFRSGGGFSWRNQRKS